MFMLLYIIRVKGLIVTGRILIKFVSFSAGFAKQIIISVKMPAYTKATP